MCGVAGFFSPKREDTIVEKMLEVQAYREPDDRGGARREGLTYSQNHDR